MEKGNIIEEGSHVELLFKKGEYYRLWKNQTVHVEHIEQQFYAMRVINMSKIYSFDQFTDSVELLERKPPRFIAVLLSLLFEFNRFYDLGICWEV